MIYSSEKRFFESNLLLGGIGLETGPLLKPGGRRGAINGDRSALELAADMVAAQRQSDRSLVYSAAATATPSIFEIGLTA